MIKGNGSDNIADQKHAPTIAEPETLLKHLTDRIGWYHHDVNPIDPIQQATTPGMTGFQRPDPLRYRTFGAVILANGGLPGRGRKSFLSAKINVT